MRRLLPAVGLAIVLLAAGCSSGSDNSQAATVNGEKVPVSRLTDMVKAQLAASQQQQNQQQQQPTDIDALTRHSLEGLIQFQIILDGARKDGVTVDEGQVDARVQQVKDQAASQGMKFEDLLSQNNVSESLLREQFRAQIALSLVGAKLVPQPSDAQLLKNNLAKHRTDVIQIHVRHVLVKDQATAQKARQQLLNGGDWSVVAKQLSTDPGSKDHGGDLGFESKGQTVAEFEKAIFSLANQGDCKGKTSGSCTSPISAPVHTQLGYHVIQVIGVRVPALTDELRNQLDPTLQQRRNAATEQWFTDHVRQASVSVNPRFGRWDSSSGKVVERTTAPASPTSAPQQPPVTGP
ncbi:MAG TPA: peptidylprolyl isomerase [Actinomycetota bacterium]|nr:peptidylprolyl isomerase [Actinomycetota bacterium]